VREGAALLQGLATCGHCGRRLHTHYSGRSAAPGYHCSGKDLVEGRGVYCLTVGGIQIDEAVTTAFLAALTPAAVDAALVAAHQLDHDDETALAQWRLAVERARYEAERAERRYRAVEPENRLVARGLETEWEQRLRDLELAQRELEARAPQRRRVLDRIDTERLRALGDDLRRVWTAPTTTDRDKKELLRALLEEVVLAVERDERRAHLTLRWRGGTITQLPVRLRASPPRIRTDEDSLALIRRLAPHYPDAVIAGIRIRLGAPGLAVVPLRRAVVPVADPRCRGHPLGRADLHGDYGGSSSPTTTQASSTGRRTKPVVGAGGAGPEEADGVGAEAPGGVPALALSAGEAGDRGDQPDLAGLGELFPGRQRGAVLQHREELGREEGAASYDAGEGPPGLRLEAVE
jgi:Recombinase zinc beta ribbon domain